MWPLPVSRETFLKNQSSVTYWKIKAPCFGSFAAELGPIKRDFLLKIEKEQTKLIIEAALQNRQIRLKPILFVSAQKNVLA